LATEGSVLELISLDLSWSGILNGVVIENGLEVVKGVSVVGRMSFVLKVQKARAVERTSSREADMMEFNYVKSGAESRPL
jgi:hypothetical protein